MKRSAYILLLISFLFIFGSCKKVLNPRVKYFVDGTSTRYSVSYKNENGELVTVDTIPYNWSVSFDGEKDMPLLIEATAFENNCWAKVYVYIDGRLLNSDYQFGNKPTARVEEKLKLVF